MMGVTGESNKNGCKVSGMSGEEDNVAYENKCHVVFGGYLSKLRPVSINDKCEVVNRLALKHGTVLQEDENRIF